MFWSICFCVSCTRKRKKERVILSHNIILSCSRLKFIQHFWGNIVSLSRRWVVQRNVAHYMLWQFSEAAESKKVEGSIPEQGGHLMLMLQTHTRTPERFHSWAKSQTVKGHLTHCSSHCMESESVETNTAYVTFSLLNVLSDFFLSQRFKFKQGCLSPILIGSPVSFSLAGTRLRKSCSAKWVNNLTEIKPPVRKVLASAGMHQEVGGKKEEKEKKKCVLVSVSTPSLPAGVKRSLMTANEEVRGVSACE